MAESLGSDPSSRISRFMNPRPFRTKPRWSGRSGPGSRSRAPRPFRETILIFCEGRETEPNYFHALKQDDEITRKYDITVKGGKGGSRLQIVRNLLDHVRNVSKPDLKYCILDTERLSTQVARKDFADAMDLSAENGVECYISNPAFEVWFLAHFVRTCRQFNGCDAVILGLEKHWKKSFSQSYEKSNRSIYQKLRDRIRIAIDNARKVCEIDHKGKRDIIECNSSTQIYLLIDKLLTSASQD
jgi:hypothetical protein